MYLSRFCDGYLENMQMLFLYYYYYFTPVLLVQVPIPRLKQPARPAPAQTKRTAPAQPLQQDAARKAAGGACAPKIDEAVGTHPPQSQASAGGPVRKKLRVSTAGAMTALLALCSFAMFCGPMLPAGRGGPVNSAHRFAALPAPRHAGGRVLTSFDALPAVGYTAGVASRGSSSGGAWQLVPLLPLFLGSLLRVCVDVPPTMILMLFSVGLWR